MFGRFFFARLCRIIQQECAKFWAKCLFSISCTTLCTHKLIPQMKFDSRIRPLEHTTLETFNIEHGVTIGRTTHTHPCMHTYKLNYISKTIFTFSHAPAYCWNGGCSSLQFKNELNYCCGCTHSYIWNQREKKRAIQSIAEFRESDCFLAISIWNHIQFIGFPECDSFQSFFSN